MRSKISQKTDNTVRALDRGLHVLNVLETAGRTLSLTELRVSMRLSNATLLRMLSTLEQHGLVEKGHGGYRLGVAVLPLAHGFLLGNELTLAALPILQELARMSGVTASLFVRFRFHRIVIQRVEGRHSLTHFLPTGQRLPLHLGAGKVLAAEMPDDELNQMLDLAGEMQLATGERLTKRALIAELKSIRKQGYAISSNERVMGTASVAAPIVTASGATIAALGVTGSTDRMTSKALQALCVDVRRAAKAISEQCSSACGRQ
jgi:DNA-binding IclR family transcriptional regulator